MGEKQYFCRQFRAKEMVELQKQIVKTAGEMFFRLGIRSVSIDDICRELGISKKTFYVYFESKDALIEQQLASNLEYISGKMEELLSLNDFRELVKVYVKHSEAEKNDVRRVPQLVYDLKKYYPRQFADFQEKCFVAQKNYIRRYLEQGVAQGLVRSDLDVELAAVLFAKIHGDAIRDIEIIEAHNHNMLQLRRTSMDIFVRGVLSEEGLKLYK